MRQLWFACSILFGLADWSGTLSADPPQRESRGKINLRVLYIGRVATPRGKSYLHFLERRFAHAEAAERNTFDPKQASGFDAVVLDWSQSDRQDKPTALLGAKETWDKPTVLLGRAGLLLAEAWEIQGTIG